mmetsp:Transcript_55156/g.152781  ORF Transcript_55156/g.152781 Transcript_55156/m.152781 type:complete len:85 (-) Transcript_55156:607-861(-)
MPRPPPGVWGGHAEINSPADEGMPTLLMLKQPFQLAETAAEPRVNAIHLVSILLPFSWGRTYLTVCSRIRPWKRPTFVEDFLSM